MSWNAAVVHRHADDDSVGIQEFLEDLGGERRLVVRRGQGQDRGPK